MSWPLAPNAQPLNLCELHDIVFVKDIAGEIS